MKVEILPIPRGLLHPHYISKLMYNLRDLYSLYKNFQGVMENHKGRRLTLT